MMSILNAYLLNHLENNSYIRYIQAKQITIECQENIIYDIDGEEGTNFPIHISVVHKALNVIIP